MVHFLSFLSQIRCIIISPLLKDYRNKQNMALVHATSECAMAFAKNDLSNDLNNEQCTTKMQRQQKPALRSQSYLYSIEDTVQSIKHTGLSPSCRNNNENHAYARRLNCQNQCLFFSTEIAVKKNRLLLQYLLSQDSFLVSRQS